MNPTTCKLCQGPLKKNGFTSAGRQRFVCTSCGASLTIKPDTSAKRLELFLRWLMSKATEADMGMSARTFRRKTEEFWRIWPVSRPDGVVHRVVGIDGKWVSRGGGVILVAADGSTPVAWTLAGSESKGSWKSLMRDVPAPRMAVADGMNGFPSAIREVWPGTLYQRCLFHVYQTVKSRTTSRPRTECSREMLALAKALKRVRNASQAASWAAAFAEWDGRWRGYLAERSDSGEWLHRDVVKARNGLERALGNGSLFAFVKAGQIWGGEWPSTNNAVEGGINSRIQAVWRNHPGFDDEKKAKSAMWWLWLHSGQRTSCAEALRSLPTDDDLREMGRGTDDDDGTPGWGDGVDWHDYHI